MKNMFERLKKLFRKKEDVIVEYEDEIRRLKNEITQLNTEIGGLKELNRGLASDVASYKRRFASMKHAQAAKNKNTSKKGAEK